MNDVGMTIAGATATQSRERPPEASGPAGPFDAAAVRRRWPWVLAAVIVAGFIAVVLMELYVPGGETSTDAEEAADCEMLFSLRLDAFFSGDNKENSIDAARASEHVADKELVPRNIDEADAQRAIVGRRSVQRSKS